VGGVGRNATAELASGRVRRGEGGLVQKHRSTETSSGGAGGLKSGFFEAWLRCPMDVKKTAPGSNGQPGARLHPWRTVGPNIPCQVASQQSLTPFLQAIPILPKPQLSRRNQRRHHKAGRSDRTNQPGFRPSGPSFRRVSLLNPLPLSVTHANSIGCSRPPGRKTGSLDTDRR